MKIMLFILYNLIPKPEILTHFYKENSTKLLTALSSEIINVHKTETSISKEMDTLRMLSHFSCNVVLVSAIHQHESAIGYTQDPSPHLPPHATHLGCHRAPG